MSDLEYYRRKEQEREQAEIDEALKWEPSAPHKKPSPLVKSADGRVAIRDAHPFAEELNYILTRINIADLEGEKTKLRLAPLRKDLANCVTQAGLKQAVKAIADGVGGSIKNIHANLDHIERTQKAGATHVAQIVDEARLATKANAQVSLDIVGAFCSEFM